VLPFLGDSASHIDRVRLDRTIRWPVELTLGALTTETQQSFPAVAPIRHAIHDSVVADKPALDALVKPAVVSKLHRTFHAPSRSRIDRARKRRPMH
jgi:hypothetical protein